MRRPRRTDRYEPPTPNMAAASLPSWLDEETGRLDALEDPNMVELEPINIRGNPDVIELDPIDIVGDPNAPARRIGEGSPAPAGTRADNEPKPMNRDWLDIIGDALPSVVDDERLGTGIEIPNWVAREAANADGTMPTGVLETLGNLVMRAPGRVIRSNPITNAIYGDALPDWMLPPESVAPEDRTVNPTGAAVGAVDYLSRHGADEAIAALPDEITQAAIGMSSEDAARDFRGGLDWARREMPGSVAVGEAAGMAADMALPAQSLAGRSIPQAGRLAAAEAAIPTFAEGVLGSDADTLEGRVRDAVPATLTSAALGRTVGRLGARFNNALEAPIDERQIQRLREDAAMDWLSHGAGGRDVVAQRMLAGGVPEADMPAEALRQVERMRAHDVIPAPARVTPRRGGQVRGRVNAYRAIPDAAEMAESGVRIGEQGGEAIETVAERMRDIPLETDGLVNRLQARADALADSATHQAQRSELQGWADTYARPTQGYMTDWDQMQRAKTQMGQRSDFGAELQSTASDAYGDIRDEMQSLVDFHAPDLGDTYRHGRQDYQLGETFRGVDARRRLRESRNRIGTLTNTILAGAGMTTAAQLAEVADMTAGVGAPAVMAGAALAGAANQFARTNEHAIRAINREMQVDRILRRPELARQWGPSIRQAMQRGPRAVNAMLYMIQQRDPEAREAMQADDLHPEAQSEPMEAPAPVIEVTDEMTLDDLIDDEAPIEITEETTLEDLL